MWSFIHNKVTFLEFRKGTGKMSERESKPGQKSPFYIIYVSRTWKRGGSEKFVYFLVCYKAALRAMSGIKLTYYTKHHLSFLFNTFLLTNFLVYVFSGCLLTYKRGLQTTSPESGCLGGVWGREETRFIKCWRVARHGDKNSSPHFFWKPWGIETHLALVVERGTISNVPFSNRKAASSSYSGCPAIFLKTTIFLETFPNLDPWPMLLNQNQHFFIEKQNSGHAFLT